MHRTSSHILAHHSAESERREKEDRDEETRLRPISGFDADEVLEALELTPGAAVGFIAFASCALTGLFFAFKYAPNLALNIIVGMYCLGSVAAGVVCRVSD